MSDPAETVHRIFGVDGASDSDLGMELLRRSWIRGVEDERLVSMFTRMGTLIGERLVPNVGREPAYMDWAEAAEVVISTLEAELGFEGQRALSALSNTPDLDGYLRTFMFREVLPLLAAHRCIELQPSVGVVPPPDYGY